ncbi:MAG: VPLPA-CTERM sorting domain-containing protein [Nitrospiria bacterium]
MKKFTFKQMMMAIFAFVMILAAGFSQEAKAFSVNAGDMYLILYGNSTEYYQDLGTLSSLQSPGNSSFNISSSTLATVSGINSVKWAVAGFYLTGNQGIYVALNTNPSLVNPANTSIGGGFVNFAGFFGLTTDSNPLTTSMTLPSGNANSYSNQLDINGDGSFGGSFIGQSTRGSINGNSMYLVTGDQVTNAVTGLKTTAGAQLFASVISNAITGGLTLNVAPSVVPLPASVVMFGTGLIALAGIARRRLFVA